MGYFPNGSSAEFYEEEFCSKCEHGQDAVEARGGEHCAVWFAHLLHNYEECNKAESLLHYFIPRLENGCNGKCKMFLEVKAS